MSSAYPPAHSRKYDTNGQLRLSTGFFQRYFESDGTNKEIPILQVTGWYITDTYAAEQDIAFPSAATSEIHMLLDSTFLLRTGTLQTHMLLNRTLLSLGLVHLKHRCCSRVRWVFPELSGLKHLRKYPLSLAATHSSA
ncbi:unnamed protein product [Cylicocyclus nassatus]|uniref:Uncharacterized protein n=1 Tax=Cylicocyclus nassatus TaxID=53992 RepID=A0AA36H927_CYLNA|nr:unnamed protein product [Cylicocyclus nassatus]